MNKLGNKSTLTIRRTVCYICLVIFAFLSLFPFYVLMVNSSQPHAEIQKGFHAWFGPAFGKNFASMMSNPNIPILRGLFNSVIVSFGCSILTTYFSAMTAYGIYMYNFKGKNAAFKFILAVMMVPAQVSTLGFIKLIDRIGLMDTLSALILPSIAAPIVFFYIYQSMEATLPVSIVEASRVDGCNEFRTFNQIVLPMIKPAMAVQLIFSFVGAWNNYFTPALVINSKTKKTIPILIAQLRGADYQKFDMGQVYMLITLAIVPLIIVYLFFSKNIISGTTVGGVKE